MKAPRTVAGLLREAMPCKLPVAPCACIELNEIPAAVLPAACRKFRREIPAVSFGCEPCMSIPFQIDRCDLNYRLKSEPGNQKPSQTRKKTLKVRKLGVIIGITGGRSTKKESNALSWWRLEIDGEQTPGRSVEAVRTHPPPSKNRGRRSAPRPPIFVG